ncbi:PAS domain S-box-containing protein/diguanylate cyclase (GGDEF) domain-containing protein [Nocardioides alpinus]|uniref:PAS domain S-box-containing protein/diguanylate cyclase (GGDEF) domain-containing protein n=1 Tax=Nocardioides alpinus TaxID=748909 RepID=A0A1I1BE56_9ACTN|nr:EAL domain-containing protein [Nocardioides alpinus]SFB48397.1 PAS domain S-box-containing protein/diguanylate cyclase (GGDEF) domain-containing protein [Nocardioides alpinus]
MRRRVSGTATVPSSSIDLRRGTPTLALPFAVVAVIGLITVLLPPYDGPWWVIGLAVLVLGLSALVFFASRLRGRRSWLDPLAAYLLFPYAALLHDAAGAGAGGSSSGMTALLLLPILWLAITGTPHQLWVASALAVLTFAVPIVLVGPPGYSWGDWRRAVVWCAVALVIAPVLQRIVRDLVRQSRRVRIANDRVERLFDDAPHGVALLDPVGTIIRVNVSMSVMVGLEPVDMVGHRLGAFETPGEDRIQDHLGRLMFRRGESHSTECRLRDSGGNDVNVSLSSTVVSDSEMGDIVMVNVVDISDRRRYLDRLSHLADHDVLTGLANRRRFETELERHLDHCRRHGPSGALLLLDLDNFKQVNDSLGHNAGDQLLVVIAGLLRRSIRSTDVVGRLGGDEFAILLTDADQADAARVAELVVERVRTHAATLDGVARRVTASVGAVTFRAASEHAADALALADMTMYDAKEAGRNQVAVLTEGDVRGPRTSARLHWQSRIEAALENDRFELHLQPIMNIADGRISSAEVLLRLRDQDELVPPARFIYIAERVGLMPRVDAWVVDKSLELLARLRREHDPEFEFEVNLSGHSIGSTEIESVIVSSLATHGVDPSALILEITETAAVGDVALARDFAERMTDLGCAFALDDFGAGFGSFYYLKHLFFDYVKIDGEFVAHVHESQVDRTIMRSIVGIARDLGKRTVAEFVSSQEILDVCREEGVDFAQGYLIGKPVPYDEFVERFMPSATAVARG